jgi:putative transposase
MRPGQEKAIFEQQNKTLQLAREIHPERWGSRPARVWETTREVVLNPDEK